MSIKAKETLWFNFSSKPLKEDITDTSRNRLLIHILAGNLCKLSFTETTRQRKQYLTRDKISSKLLISDSYSFSANIIISSYKVYFILYDILYLIIIFNFYITYYFFVIRIKQPNRVILSSLPIFKK